MGIQNNSFTRFFPNCGFVSGLVTLTAGVPSVGSLSGNAIDDANVSVTDVGTGLASIVVTDFKGPQGFCFAGAGIALSTGFVIAASSGTYSGNTVTVPFATALAASSVLTDVSFTFQLWAY